MPIAWQCTSYLARWSIKEENIDDRYKVVKEKKLCFSWFIGSHRIKDYKTRECGIDGSEKVHNWLLHKTVKSVENAVNEEETNLTTTSKTIVLRALNLVPIRVHGKAESDEDIKALRDTGSSQTWVDHELLEKLKLDGEEGGSDNSCGWCSWHLTNWKQESWSYPWAGKYHCCSYVYYIAEQSQEFGCWKKRLWPEVTEAKVWMFFMHKSKHHTPLWGWSNTWTRRIHLFFALLPSRTAAVKLQLAWTLGHWVDHCPPQKWRNAIQCVVWAKDEELTPVVKQGWDLESYGRVVLVDNRSNQDRQPWSQLNKTVQY